MVHLAKMATKEVLDEKEQEVENSETWKIQEEV